jgi:hypothetical protein
MPPKTSREMTGDEVKMLVLASKLLAALQEYAERPPPPSEQAHWDKKADLDIVRPYHLFTVYLELTTLSRKLLVWCTIVTRLQ